MNAIDVQQAIRSDYPLLYEKGEQYDFAERLGGRSDPLLAEIDAALREVWSARRALADLETLVQAAGAITRDPEFPGRGPLTITRGQKEALAAAVARVKGDTT